MKSLSALDAAFLFLEAEHAPMHIGSLYILQPGPGFEFKAFCNHIEARLHRWPPFRQRLQAAPMSLGYPFWVDDPHFHVRNHIRELRLSDPGNKDQLLEMTAGLFASQLSRERPLWDMTLITGPGGDIEGVPGRYGLVTRVHHAAIDGVSGAELMGALLDLEPRLDVPVAKPSFHPQTPAATDLLGASLRQSLRYPAETIKTVGELAGRSVQLLGKGLTGAAATPPPLFTAPKTPFNRKVGKQRIFRGTRVELDRIKKIKKLITGVTVNDVVLTLCAEALRAILLARDVLPEKPLVAMCPISVRDRRKHETGGNQVSGMLVSLATHEPDILKRLMMIQGNTKNSKMFGHALPVPRILETLPSATAAMAGRLYTRLRLGDDHRPFFNLVITNVPGPQKPLFLAGATLVETMGTAPLMDGLGLILVIFSYDGSLSLGVTSTPEILPDADAFIGHFEAGLARLEMASLMHAKADMDVEKAIGKPGSASEDSILSSVQSKDGQRLAWALQKLETWIEEQGGSSQADDNQDEEGETNGAESDQGERA